MPDDDTDPPPDPLDAELVAYLDGELDPAAARRVEARLAADPDARARAAALRQTFDLLDYLPKPDPSPTFATRTLDRLPAATTGAGGRTAPDPGPPAPTVPGPSGTVPVPAAPPPTRWAAWAAGLLAAVPACAAAGYFVTAAARPHLFPAPPPAAADLPISDRRAVGMLPLYAAADDLDYVRELARPEFFGDDPAVAFDPSLRPAQEVEPDAPSGPAFETLAATFKALPPARREAVRDLDRQLHALAPEARDGLVRVLEVYALWLDRLPEAERRAVLAATTPRGRLDEVRKVRGQQWFDALPEVQRKKLDGLPPDRRDEHLLQLKKDEARWHDDWAFVRRHAPDIAANRAPWPFDDEARRKEVVEWARAAFRPDDRRSRLAAADAENLRNALAAAEKDGGWAWYRYGRAVADLRRRYEPLPEPAAGPPVTTYDQLGPLADFFRREKSAAHRATAPHVGRWPEFALAVHGYAGPLPKGEKLPPLGPARPDEFREPVRALVTEKLLPALPDADRKALDALSGRWPEYPRKVVELARQQDLVLPGLMPPGSPKKWDALYPRPRP